MKKTIAKALALTCTALLGTAVFAQEESRSPVQYESQISAGSLTLNKSEFTISLHGSDYGDPSGLRPSAPHIVCIRGLLKA